MAACDYKLCDKCGNKAFYDSDLGYCLSTRNKQIPESDCLRECGVISQGISLGRLGDWAVLCRDCAKTHRTQIVPIEPKAHPHD